MRWGDSLMLVADRERSAATDSPKGHPSFNCLHFRVAVSVASKRSLLCFLCVGRSYVFAERGWTCPPSFAAR